MRVVNDDQIATPARHGAACAERKIFALGGGLPLTRCGGVCVDGHAREHFLVGWIAQQVSHLSAKVHSKISGVGRLNDVLVGVMPEEVCGKKMRRKL